MQTKTKIFKKYKPYSIRLKHYNYSSSGEYFVTICVKDFKCVFGKVVGGEMVLNELGGWLKKKF